VKADCLLSSGTIEKYEEVSRQLIFKLDNMNVRKIGNFTIDDLKTTLNNVKNKKGKSLSPSRKNHYLVVLKNLLKYLIDYENIKVYNPELIKKYKIPQKEVSYLTREELIRLSNAPNSKNITGLRMRVAIKSIISTGCRVSELLNLNIDDINFKTGIASIRTKGDKPHQVIFNQESLSAISEYLKLRNDNCEALFATANSSNPKRWQVNDFQRSLRNLGHKLGFKISITPHLIGRRSTATLMYKEGVPLGIIQKFLNHSSAQVTTKFYIGNLDFDEVRKYHKEVMNFDIDASARKEGET
jgi:integrase/recombinase XerD